MGAKVLLACHALPIKHAIQGFEIPLVVLGGSRDRLLQGVGHLRVLWCAAGGCFYNVSV